MSVTIYSQNKTWFFLVSIRTYIWIFKQQSYSVERKNIKEKNLFNNKSGIYWKRKRTIVQQSLVLID